MDQFKKVLKTFKNYKDAEKFAKEFRKENPDAPTIVITSDFLKDQYVVGMLHRKSTH